MNNYDLEKLSRLFLLTEFDFQAIEHASSDTCGPVVSSFTFPAKQIKMIEISFYCFLLSVLFTTYICTNKTDYVMNCFRNPTGTQAHSFLLIVRLGEL